MKNGWKTLSIYGEIGKELCDIAVFGENSLVFDGLQFPERIITMTLNERKGYRENNGKELPHNFIRDCVVIL